MTPTYIEFQNDSRNRAVLKKSLKLSKVNPPVVAFVKATNTTCTTGITRKINKKQDMSSMTAASPGCFLNSEIASSPHSEIATLPAFLADLQPVIIRKIGLVKESARSSGPIRLTDHSIST